MRRDARIPISKILSFTNEGVLADFLALLDCGVHVKHAELITLVADFDVAETEVIAVGVAQFGDRAGYGRIDQGAGLQARSMP